MKQPENDKPPQRRRRIDRERILDAAMDIVDREGIDRLSMRRLGRKLGVDPMAIYHHVPDKQAIVSGLVQRCFAGMNVRGQGPAWQDRVRAWARAYREIGRQHPNLVVHLVTDVYAAVDGTLKSSEELYAALESSGLETADVARAADLIVDYTNGVILAFASQPESNVDGRDILQEQLRASGPNDFPSMRRVLESVAGRVEPGDFDFGLDIIIGGLENRIPG